MLLVIANLDKLTVSALDIKSAYLHATVKSNIYGRMSKKVLSYSLRLYPVNQDGSTTFKVL